MLAALDVGSSFEGMGASREAAFGALAEPALLAALLAAAGQGGLRLADGVAAVDFAHGGGVLLGIAVFLLLLVENACMPVDDPNTHLELTMIHEVMVLDHSGPELAAITYGAALKLWVFAALLVALVLPLHAVSLPWAVVAHVVGTLVVAAAVGVVESLSARLPMPRVPAFILSGAACGLVVLFAVIWGGRL
jgi:formate hydrogenlyase subunit 4